MEATVSALMVIFLLNESFVADFWIASENFKLHYLTLAYRAKNYFSKRFRQNKVNTLK